jgi:hypothetical protein
VVRGMREENSLGDEATKESNMSEKINSVNFRTEKYYNQGLCLPCASIWQL